MNCEFNLQPATTAIAEHSTRKHQPVALTCIGTALFIAFLSSCTTTGEHSTQDMHADGTEHTQASETPGEHAKQHNMENTTSHNMKHDAGHGHGIVDASSWTLTPGISLSVTPDAMSGWNIHIHTTNFTFAPENVNTKPMHNEGHAHLFIDGKKIGRVYSNWYHMNPLPQGSHSIRVSLNANDHSELALMDKPLDATLTIVQK